MFKNPEVRWLLVLTLVLALLGFALGWSVAPEAGALAGGLCLAAGLSWMAGAAFRYRRLGRLAEDVARIAHGDDSVDLSRYKEGELSLLYSALSKMTVRLREQAQLLEGDKVRLADAIADISHQIRTPLTALNLRAAALEDPERAPEERRMALRDVRVQLQRIDWLISSLLKLARLDAGTVKFDSKPVTLETLVAKAAEPLAIFLELRDQRLETTVQGSLTCDLSWTVEALGNILKNCAEAMGPGVLEVTGEENALYTQLVVRDHGPGIAPEDQPHLFERFYRGRGASEQSVGIGLALSRTIVTSQNGTLKAENHPQGGAMFTLRFYKSVV